MDKKELLDNLRILTEAVETLETLETPGNLTSIESFMEHVLSTTSESDMLAVVGEFIHQMKAKGGEGALEKWLRDNGWAKVGEEVPIRAVVNAIAVMPQSSMQEACRKLVDLLINQDSNVNSTFFEALNEHEIYEEGSEQFAEAAKEWAEENDWVDTNSTSLDDVAERYGSGDVRDFVVEYIQDHL